MEDDLNTFKMEDNLTFLKMEGDLNFWMNGIYFLMEDNNNSLLNGRRPHLFPEWKTYFNANDNLKNNNATKHY